MGIATDLQLRSGTGNALQQNNATHLAAVVIYRAISRQILNVAQTLFRAYDILKCVGYVARSVSLGKDPMMG